MIRTKRFSKNKINYSDWWKSSFAFPKALIIHAFDYLTMHKLSVFKDYFKLEFNKQ